MNVPIILRAVIAAALVITILLSSANARAPERPRIVIEAIIDNGGTVTEEGAQGVINSLLGALANLRGRDFSEARVDLVLTSHPTTVWSGTPKDLMKDGRAVLELVTINDRCSDLGRSFLQADQNLRIAAGAEAYVVIFSPLINAPFPCDSGPGITLPQPVPDNLALGRFALDRQLKALLFFGVHPSQEQVWTDYLIAQGILTLASEAHLNFQFLGFAQSRTYLAGQRLDLKEEE